MPETLLTAWLRKSKAVVDAPPPAQKKSYATAAALDPSLLVIKRDQTSSYTAALSPSENAPPPVPPALSNNQNTPQNRTPSALRLLPPNLILVPPSAPLLPAFKLLNQALFPIPYPPAFYTETLSDPITRSITLFALWHPVPPTTSSPTTTSPDRDPPTLIGAIRCRLLPAPKSDTAQAQGKPDLYISTLCVLPPYRRHGCASHLLARVTESTVREHGIGSVSAHVWEANTEGREWYRRRGFEEVGVVEGYYRRLKPGGAVLVRRGVGIGDLVGWREGLDWGL